MTRWSIVPLVALATLLVGAVPVPGDTDAAAVEAVTLSTPEPDWCTDARPDRRARGGRPVA